MKIVYTLFLSVFILIYSCFNGITQEIENYESSIADCVGAVDVTNFDSSNVQLPGNFGKVRDLEKSFPDDFETNSVWLRLEPNLNGEFGFEISSESNIDFNYYLYKDLTGNMCKDLINGDVLPIRSDSLSLKTKGIKGGNSKNEITLKNAIKTKPLDVYYLLIHSNSKHQGNMKITYFRNGEVVKEKTNVLDYRTNPKYKTLKLKIRDKATGEPIEANVTILGLKIDEKLFQGADFLFDLKPTRYIEVIVNAKGYFLEIYKSKYRSVADAELTIEIEKLAPGRKLKMEGLKFEKDSKEFLSVSSVTLKRLLDFMVVNNDIKIEIQGHVNAPGYGARVRVMKLSEDRAKMAYKYLIKNGISKKRVTYKGYGNMHMVFKSPTTPEQENANRRVEILIVE